MVDPINPVSACDASYQPKKQNIDFVHTAPSSASSSDDDEKCVPRENTPFCTRTAKHRQDQVNPIKLVSYLSEWSGRAKPFLILVRLRVFG